MTPKTTANPGDIIGRGLSFPPRVVAGRMAWAEGERHVSECIRLILMTELGERLRLPQFGCGLGAFLFEPNTVGTRQLIVERMARAIARWEPRVTVESLTVEPDPNDPEAAIATVIYMLVATQAQAQLQVSLALAG